MRNPLYNDDIVKKAKKRYQLSREYTQPYFDRFLDNYKHYFIRVIDEAQEKDATAYPFFSNLMLPISFQIVETIVPRMLARLPNFSIQTEDNNDPRDEAAMRELIKYQMNHPYLIDDPIYLRFQETLKELFIAGNAWGEVPWIYREAEVEEWQPYSAQLGIQDANWEVLQICDQYGVKPDWKLVKTKKRVMDAPVYRNQSIFHVFPDPKKQRVSEMGYIIVEDWMTKDEIMELAEQAPEKWQNMDAFAQMQAMKEYGNKGYTNYDEEIASIFNGQDYSTKDSEEGQFKVWFMREPGRMSVIINEKLCIRDGDNPNGDNKIGLFLGKDIPIPGQLYGWGEVDPIKRIEDAMSDQINMRNDNVFYDLMRMWLVDPQALVEGEEFIPEPGSITEVKDMNAIKPLETGNTKASAYREYQEWDRIVQNVSGVSGYATGNADPSMNDTAAGIEALQSAANARFMMKLMLFEQLILKATGTYYVTRNMRFFDTPQTVPTDKGKVTITPDNLRRLKGNVHFIVDSGSTESMNRQTTIKKWESLIGMIGKPPFHNLSEQALDEYGRRMLYALEEQDVDILLQRQVAPQAPLGMGGAALPALPGGTNGTEQIPTEGAGAQTGAILPGI